MTDWEKLRSAAAPLAAKAERLLGEGGGVTKLFFGIPEMETALARLDASGIVRPALNRFDSGEYGIWTLATLDPEAPVPIVLCSCSLSPSERAAKFEAMGVGEPGVRPREIQMTCPDPAGKAA